jgi:hypothetical protein
VVGGLYDAEDNGLDDNNTATYYRVDFSTGTGDTEEFLDVLRNHLYTFTIEEVNSAGHNELDDAFEDGSDNLLSAKVTAWNLAGQNVIAHGQHYLNVNEGEIAFETAGGTAKFVAETNYTIDDRGFPAGIEVEQSEGSEWLALSLSGNSGDLSRTVTLTATATTVDRTAKVYIRVGNLTKVITVTQEEGVLYVGRFGGELEELDGGTRWRFERALYIQAKDNGSYTLRSDAYIGPDIIDDPWDGKGNTLTLIKANDENANPPVTHPAADVCFTKNSGYASITEKDDPNYRWYLPAWEQWVAAWVSRESFGDAKPDDGNNGDYWSSTKLWGMFYRVGSMKKLPPAQTFRVRCVREGAMP